MMKEDSTFKDTESISRLIDGIVSKTNKEADDLIARVKRAIEEETKEVEKEINIRFNSFKQEIDARYWEKRKKFEIEIRLNARKLLTRKMEELFNRMKVEIVEKLYRDFDASTKREIIKKLVMECIDVVHSFDMVVMLNSRDRALFDSDMLEVDNGVKVKISKDTHTFSWGIMCIVNNGKFVIDNTFEARFYRLEDFCIYVFNSFLKERDNGKE